MWKWILGVPVGLFALMMIIGAMSPTSSESGTARRAIDHCWSEQQRKSLPPDQARFIAGACERMERDYQAKYGRAP